MWCGFVRGGVGVRSWNRGWPRTPPPWPAVTNRPGNCRPRHSRSDVRSVSLAHSTPRAATYQAVLTLPAAWDIQAPDEHHLRYGPGRTDRPERTHGTTDAGRLAGKDVERGAVGARPPDVARGARRRSRRSHSGGGRPAAGGNVHDRGHRTAGGRQVESGGRSHHADARGRQDGRHRRHRPVEPVQRRGAAGRPDSDDQALPGPRRVHPQHGDARQSRRAGARYQGRHQAVGRRGLRLRAGGDGRRRADRTGRDGHDGHGAGHAGAGGRRRGAGHEGRPDGDRRRVRGEQGRPGRRPAHDDRVEPDAGIEIQQPAPGRHSRSGHRAALADSGAGDPGVQRHRVARAVPGRSGSPPFDGRVRRLGAPPFATPA